jgi:hypothetical protein
MSKTIAFYRSTIYDSPVSSLEADRFKQFQEKRQITSYKDNELYDYLCGIQRKYPLPTDSSCFITHLSIIPFYGYQWSNDMYRPLRPDGTFEVKPLTISPIKTADQYNPRLSKGKIESTFHIWFRREIIYQSYPTTKSDITINSIRISTSDETKLYPPTITLIWERIARLYEKYVPLVQSIDCILDKVVGGYASYLLCSTLRIPAVDAAITEQAFDRWTIDDVAGVQSIEVDYDLVYL